LTPIALAEMGAADGDAAFGVGCGGLIVIVEEEDFDAGDGFAHWNSGTSNIQH